MQGCSAGLVDRPAGAEGTDEEVGAVAVGPPPELGAVAVGPPPELRAGSRPCF